ncbi:MAG: peroxide stress protein YaaA [Cyclobacteriaceae bacterium]
MIAIISPAKTLDFEKQIEFTETKPDFKTEANKLVKIMREKSAADLQKQMDISQDLATLNAERFDNFSLTRRPSYAKQAAFAFKGEVYRGLDIDSLDKPEWNYLQEHLRILSGLYGLLRPFDLIQPYRLEMGTKMNTQDFSSLYEYWGDKITRKLNRALKEFEQPALINLASQEYFKAVKPEKVKAPVINIDFREYKNGDYKVIAVYAKKARGLMVRFMAENKLDDPEDLKGFDYEGYAFNDQLSGENSLVFTRR